MTKTDLRFSEVKLHEKFQWKTSFFRKTGDQQAKRENSNQFFVFSKQDRVSVERIESNEDDDVYDFYLGNTITPSSSKIIDDDDDDVYGIIPFKRNNV